MLLVPQKGMGRVQHNTGGVGASPPGTLVTTGASSSTKGTPAELITTTTFDAYWLTVIAANYASAAAACQGCLDILIGAATEEVLISNLLMGHCGGGSGALAGPKRWDFPLYIPAGSRLAAQAAGAQVSTGLVVAVFLYGGNGVPPFRVGSKVTTYGIGTVPNGATVTPGASGAEGSWAQIVASTSEDHFALIPSFQVSGDTTVGSNQFAVDLGVGAATEEEVAQSYWYRADTSERMEGPWNSMPCFLDVPAGTRLTMRASNSGTNDSGYNGAIHCVS